MSDLTERLDMIVGEMNGVTHVVQTYPEAAARIAELEAEVERLRWNLDMDAAPRDRMIIAMARYPHATAGSPSFVGWGGANGWLKYSRNAPEPMVCWAWIDRDALPAWPAEPARAALNPTGGAG